MNLEQKIKEIKKKSAPIEYRALAVDVNGLLQERESLLDQRIVEGYGCIWGNINSYQERFHKGSFAKSIADNGPGSGANYEIKFRDEHGRACALFEVLKEDETGLYFRTKPLDDVSWANDLLTQLRSGTINNFSDGFGYVFSEGAMVWNDAKECIDIYQARLMEISAVAIPADMQTFALRSFGTMDELFDLTEDFIKSLPRKNQLEARHIFARHKALTNELPHEQRNIAQDVQEPLKPAIDYIYLSQNLLK